MISELFPVLNLLDRWLAGLLPLAVRLSIWGALAGSLSMIIYAKLSPQASIRKLKTKIRNLQREMLRLDLKLADFLSLSRENLATSLKLFGTVLGPGLLSALPVLLLAVWIHTSLAYEVPEVRDDLIVTTADKDTDLRVTFHHSKDERSDEEIKNQDLISSEAMVVMIGDKTIYSGTPLSPPTPVIHKRRWWSVLLGSPAGYVVEDAPTDSIRLNLSKKQVVKGMPSWATGWECPFFVFVFLAALGIKLRFHIE
ncbi:MAG: hypothetical protein P8Z79_18660 [Sedimentisphaerales bacterium]